MKKLNDFFKPVISAMPEDRATLINQDFWSTFADYKDNKEFPICMVSLINAHPSALIYIIKHYPSWLDKIPNWAVNDLAVCLRSNRGHIKEVEILKSHFEERPVTSHTEYAINAFNRYIKEQTNQLQENESHQTTSCPFT